MFICKKCKAQVSSKCPNCRSSFGADDKTELAFIASYCYEWNPKEKTLTVRGVGDTDEEALNNAIKFAQTINPERMKIIACRHEYEATHAEPHSSIGCGCKFPQAQN